MKPNDLQIFKNMKFSIYEYGNELAPKRSKILKEIVEKNAGEFILYNNIKANNIPDFIISTKRLNLATIKLHNNIKLDLIKNLFVDLKWVNDCIKENFLIDRSNYCLNEESISNGEKRKAGISEIDFNEKRKKICSSEKKNSPSFTKALLEKIDSETKEFHNKNDSKYLKMKYFDKLYFQNNSDQKRCSIKENFKIKNQENITHTDKFENSLSKISETSITNIDISTSKKPNENSIVRENNPCVLEKDFHNLDKYFESERENKLFDKSNENPIERDSNLSDDGKNFLKINQIFENEYNDKLFEKIKEKILKYDEEKKDEIQLVEIEDEKSTDYTNLENKEDFFDKKRDFTIDDDLLSSISKEDHTEKSNSLFEVPEKNNLNFKNMEWRKKFACSSGSNLNNHNLNEHITSELEKMLEYHVDHKNHFEANAYRKAINQLKNTKEKITVVDDIKNIKFVGNSISSKIKEILLTGKIRKAEFLRKNDEKFEVCNIFMKIHGIGIVAANHFYQKGYRTIEDLRNHQEELNTTQKIGLKYYEDIQVRIPRKECDEIFNKIKDELYKILPENIVEIVLCGSYRRGKTSCGDMDILITRKDNGGIDGILCSLTSSLNKIGLIKDTFTNLKTSHDNYVFMGVMQLNESLPNRRVDIKVYKRELFAFALLYFTGSAYFNRSMRLLANKLGYSLSDQALEKVNRIKNEKIPTGEYIECRTEEDIFKALGLSYKAPNERDI